jgi:hypothetical protein
VQRKWRCFVEAGGSGRPRLSLREIERAFVQVLCCLSPCQFGYAYDGWRAPSAAVRAACLNDAKKFCNSVIQDDEARRTCMKAHAEELSPGCKQAVAAQRSATGKGDLETCRRLARDKYYIDGGRRLNDAVGPAVVRCMKNGPSAL